MGKIQKDCTLKGKLRFREIYDNGKSFANRYLILFFKENNLTYNRVGFVATKKLGNSVIRNKFRRRIKESYRLNESNFKKGYDIIYLFRVGANKADYRDIESALSHIMKISKIKVVN